MSAPLWYCERSRSAITTVALLGLVTVLSTPRNALAADITKANNTNNLNLGASWTLGTAPTASDVGVWDSTVTAANSTAYGANLSWQGIRIANPTGLVTLGTTTATETLTLGTAGIDMTSATQNLVLNGNVVSGGGQTWSLASGRTLQLFTINTARTLTGSGQITLSNATGSGTAIFDLRPGTSGSTAFTAQAGVSGFTGNWSIGPNTVARTLRNGINAWGSGTVFLAGGTVGQHQNFNGSWTNTMELVTSTTSTIDDFNTSGTRYLQLNGVIQGSGNLTFQETNASVTTTKDSTYTLAAANTMSGTVTVASGAFLRVGGVGGDTNTVSNNVPAAGTQGTLGSAAVVNNGGLSFTRTDSWTVANAISGTGSVNVGSDSADLTTTATQNVTLSGTNTFSGPLTVFRGALSVASDVNLGAAPGTATTGRLVLNGGTLSATTGFTISSNRGIAVGPTAGSAIAVAAGQTVTYGGIIADNSGAGALTKAGSGELSLSGANTFTGTTTITGGVLKVTNAGALNGRSGTNGTPIVVRSGTLDLGYTASANAYGASTLNFSLRTGNLTMGGESGATSRIQSSSAAVNSGQPPGLGVGPGFGTTLSYDATNNGGTATIASIWSAVGSSGVTTATVAVGDSTATDVELDFTARISATTQDDGFRTTLVKSGAGTMRISAENNLPGLTVSAGTLVANHAQALGVSRTNRSNGAVNLVTNDATIDLNGFSPTVGAIAGTTGTFRNNAASTTSTLTVGNANNQSGTFSGSIIDGGGVVALTKAGTGTLTLSGTTSYSGLTTVSAGTLAYTANASTGSNLSGTTTATVDFGANTLTIGTTAAGNSTATFQGTLVGTGAVQLRGGSDSIVNIATGAAGTAGNGFTLGVVTANVPPSPFALDTGSSASDRKDFAYTNNTADVLTLSSLSGFGSIRNDSGGSNVTRIITVNQSADTIFNGGVTSHFSSGGVTRALTLQKQGVGRLTLAGFVGKQTLGGGAGPAAVNLTADGGILEVTNAQNTTTTNTDARYSGTVTITAGTLAFSDQAILNTAGSVGASSILMNGGLLRWNPGTTQDISAGGRLTLVAGKTAVFDTNDNDVTLATALAGGAVAAGLTKTGGGRLTLSATNPYTGVTLVSGGALHVNGLLSGTSGVSVNAGGILGGSGSINAAIAGAGLVSPGASPGILAATALDPTLATAYALEFTSTGSPNYGDSTASVNDVLRLTSSTPFTTSLSAGNVIDVYFDVAMLAANDAFRGGFYTDTRADFAASIQNASFAYWVKGNGGGTDRSFNGQSYFSLANFDSGLSVTLSTVAETAVFAGGAVDGQVTQFVVVPEPATLALAAAATGLAGWRFARRRA